MATKDQDAKKKAATKKKASTKSSKPKASSAKAKPFMGKADEEANLTQDEVAELYQKLLDERARVVRGLDKHLGEAVTDIDPLADEVPHHAGSLVQ
ncbi:MAG: hypothetical protein AAGA56_22935, partial [Myxococcota bacterium]